ncbi:MAG: hypothetical protein NXI14_12680 [bacterium]|nr:hypothetical protein [bacterium]
MPKVTFLYLIPASIGISALWLLMMSANQAASRLLRRSQIADQSAVSAQRLNPAPIGRVVFAQAAAWLGATVATCLFVYLSRDIEAPIYPAWLALNLTISVGALLFPLHLTIWRCSSRDFTLTTVVIAACSVAAYVVCCYVVLALVEM